MIILDTHAWIWLASNPEKLSSRAKKAIEGSKRLGLSAISCWEFAMLVERGKISIDRRPLEWIEQSLENYGMELLPLTPAIAAHACHLGPGFHGDPADRIIVSTSIIQTVPLVTKDERIRSCHIVESIW
jgi:PIN domain nuclease of toxin-antitoxin system